MAEANPQVMEMVEAQLKQNPDISNAELLGKAKEIDPGIAELSARQFNAMYPLQVKRAMKPAKKRAPRSRAKSSRAGSSGTRSRRATGGADRREKVRKALLGLARDVADAQGKGDVVDVIAGIDGYVDRVLKAAG